MINHLGSKQQEGYIKKSIKNPIYTPNLGVQTGFFLFVLTLYTPFFASIHR